MTYATATPAPRTPAQEIEAALELECEFAEIIVDEVGMKREFAEPIAKSIVRGLRRRRGGDALYVANMGAAERAARDAQMRADFNGPGLLAGKVAAVAEKYGVGVRRARQILTTPKKAA